MATVLNVYEAFASMRGKRLADWANGNPQAMAIVVQVEKMERNAAKFQAG